MNFMDTPTTKNAISAALFGNNPDISPEERDRVVAELEKIGSLTFAITIDEEGWSAQCAEVPGILAGGTNQKPTNAEIESQIRESIYAAFDVRLEKQTTSPYFSYGDVNHKEDSSPFSIHHPER